MRGDGISGGCPLPNLRPSVLLNKTGHVFDVHWDDRRPSVRAENITMGLRGYLTWRLAPGCEHAPPSSAARAPAILIGLDPPQAADSVEIAVEGANGIQPIHFDDRSMYNIPGHELWVLVE